MALELNGTTGVSLVQNGVLTDANMPAGSVLQVVRSTLITTQSTTSTSYTSTSHSVSITPTSASSKILLMNSATFGNSTSKNTAITIYRNGSTNLAYEAVAGSSAAPCLMDGRVNGTNDFWAASGSYMYLDSPNTTSSTTYTVYFASDTGGTGYYNTTPGTATAAVATLFALEIAA